MIKIENTIVTGWEAAIRGARMPLQSFAKSDSRYEDGYYVIGENDLDLMTRLSAAGNDHGKFMRMLHVSCDITCPAYFSAELDTYKVGTTRNSSSLQHTGMKRDFTIRDFSVSDSRIYDILDPIEKDYKLENPLTYPYETDEYRDYITENGRKYKIFKNGKVVAYPFEYVDNYGTGRKRTFPEQEIKPYQNKKGYWAIRIGGRENIHFMLHRLVAIAWLGDKSDDGLEINHKNKNRGDCSVENLEWVTHQENEIHKHMTYEETLTTRYKKHIASTKIPKKEKNNIIKDLSTMTVKEVAQKYGRGLSAIYAIKDSKNVTTSEYELFEICDIWRNVIDTLNYYRRLYVETKDYNYFRAMRQLMPMGYNYTFTWDTNYAVLKNIYYARKGHKLMEWEQMREFIETLPHADKLIIGR